MTNTKNSGFTIIELTIFVAMSALLLLVGFSAVSGRTSEAQFTDSVRTVQSQLQRNLGSVGVGLNLRSDDLGCSAAGPSGEINIDTGVGQEGIGQSRDCVANATLIGFMSDSPEGYTIEAVASAAERDDDLDSRDHILNSLNQQSTKVVPGTNQENRLLWESQFIGSFFVDESGDISTADNLHLMRIRAIDSSSEYVMAAVSSGTSFELDQLAFIEEDESYGICLEGDGDRYGSVSVTSDGSVSTEFFDSRCEGML